jgi:subtilase family serine protease
MIVPRPLLGVSATLFLCVIGCACSFAQGQALAAQTKVDETRRVQLSGTVHPLARPEYDRGAVPDSFPADRMIVMLNRQADRELALTQYLRDAHTAGSLSYHKWITPEEFGARFGARDENVQQVQAWLQSHGFSLTRLTKSRRFLEFSGTAAQVREALHSEIHQYEVEGKTYYSVAAAISIPEAMAPLIRGFAPLNTFPLTSFVHVAGKGTLSAMTRRVKPEFTTTSGGQTFYALAPEDFATQYDVGPVYQAGTDGTGETIGIIGEYNLDLTLTAAFRKLFGLPGDNTQVVIDGEDPGVGAPLVLLSPEAEGFLDVEVSGAVAPKATVNYYIAGGTYFQSTVVLAAMRAVEDNQAGVLSVAYGECEQLLGTPGNLFWAGLWEQAAAQGQTVLVASGDYGPNACPIGFVSSTGQITYTGLSVNGLASTPWNVAVGGTDFYYSDYATGGASAATLWNSTNDANYGSLKAPLPEQPWDDSLGLDIPLLPLSLVQTIVSVGEASGGGSSNCSQVTAVAGQPGTCVSGYVKPSWQNAPGVPADGVRDLPDVSLFAGDGRNLTAYAICVEPGDCTPVSSGEPQVSLGGGTSASTAAMAGIMALVDQKYGRQGQANFTLYALANQQPSVFHDITIGTNDVVCDPSDPVCATPVPNSSGEDSYGVYAAGPGYDLASGLGSLDVNALIGSWNKITYLPTSTTLLLSPSSITHGASVTVTASVQADSGTLVPTGDVSIGTTSPIPLMAANEITLAGGSATANWTFFPGGTYQVTARYAGDGTFATSTSTPSTLSVTPEPSTTALSLQYYYDDPTTTPPTLHSGTVANGGQAPIGSVWTFQAQPSGQTSQTTGDATGTATFTDGSTSATVPLNSQGIANWSPQVLALGAHSVTVNYSGDASYNASTAGPLTFTVVKGTPRLSAGLDAAVVSIAPGPTFNYLAGTVVVTVVLSASNSFVPPTGNVTVNFGSFTQTAALTTSTYSNHGFASANVTLANVPAGTYPLSASYAGDTNWNAVSYTSSTTYTLVSETTSPTTTTLSISPSSVDSSGSVKFTVTVSASQGQILPITGDVILYGNGALIGSAGLPFSTRGSNSVATATVTLPGTDLPSGSLQVVAFYEGSSEYGPSASAPVPLTVTFTDFTLSVGAPRVLVKSGQSASIPLLLGGPNGGSATISLACLPSSGSFGCAVSPSTQVVQGAGSASLTINAYILEAGSSAKLEHQGTQRGLFAASAVFALGFVLMLPLLGREQFRGLAVFFAFLAIGTFVAGCGGGSSQGVTPPPPANLNAPAGTYSVLVTGTSGSITHNSKITVVIQ